MAAGRRWIVRGSMAPDGLHVKGLWLLRFQMGLTYVDKTLLHGHLGWDDQRTTTKKYMLPWHWDTLPDLPGRSSYMVEGSRF